MDHRPVNLRQTNRWGWLPNGAGAFGQDQATGEWERLAGPNYPIGDGASGYAVTSGQTYDLFLGFGLDSSPATIGNLPGTVTLDSGDHTNQAGLFAWDLEIDDTIPLSKIYGLDIQLSDVTTYGVFVAEVSGNNVNGGAIARDGSPAEDGALFIGKATAGFAPGASLSSVRMYFDPPLDKTTETIQLILVMSGGPGTMTDPATVTIDSVEYIPYPILPTEAALTNPILVNGEEPNDGFFVGLFDDFGATRAYFNNPEFTDDGHIHLETAAVQQQGLGYVARWDVAMPGTAKGYRLAGLHVDGTTEGLDNNTVATLAVCSDTSGSLVAGGAWITGSIEDIGVNFGHGGAAISVMADDGAMDIYFDTPIATDSTNYMFELSLTTSGQPYEGVLTIDVTVSPIWEDATESYAPGEEDTDNWDYLLHTVIPGGTDPTPTSVRGAISAILKVLRQMTD